jgi:hypothetical protein
MGDPSSFPGALPGGRPGSVCPMVVHCGVSSCVLRAYRNESHGGSPGGNADQARSAHVSTHALRRPRHVSPFLSRVLAPVENAARYSMWRASSVELRQQGDVTADRQGRWNDIGGGQDLLDANVRERRAVGGDQRGDLLQGGARGPEGSHPHDRHLLLRDQLLDLLLPLFDDDDAPAERRMSAEVAAALALIQLHLRDAPAFGRARPRRQRTGW